MFRNLLVHTVTTTAAFRLPAASALNRSNFGAVRFLSDDLKARFDKAVNGHDVLVFMKGTKEAPQCGFSRAVVQVLNAQGVKYSTVNVLADEEVRNGIKEYSSWPTIPQVYVKGEFVGGCDIVVNMMQSGDLTRMFVEKELLPKEALDEIKKDEK
ncbi:UNVERIFIED_CONTAM: monothiol glutaredoxin grx5 [Siphonaria sp. JEL0065]|nr:monothiol glutaredoxin grx5 [Siphonaria sp. JEL0065]